VAFDRNATLRNAEKLLRQGKLEPAIAEYVRVVEDQPRDWNTANILGDLYVRAGQTDRAVEQFTRIADSLNEEGFLPKASALYKKILKLKPDHEHALLQAAEIAASQGLLMDARNHLTTVADRRRARGDARGAAQVRVRLGSIDPADYDARMLAANARLELNDQAGAVRDLKEIAAELIDKERQGDAIEALRAAAALTPDDEEIRRQLLQVYVATGDFARAMECASTAEQFVALASSLEAAGHADASIQALVEAARLNPDDGALRAQLARTFVARGDLQRAAEYLTAETAGDDPQLLLTAAEIKLRGDRVDEGVDLARRLLAEHPSRRDELALMGWSVAESVPEAGFRVVELAADAAVQVEDWASAAATLQEFVTRVPSHIPALMRLVEICVDGALEATMFSAQAQLADAYITAGMAAEARFIAEDLVAHEPWERANLERFKRALELLGEPDPEAIIAERLSGQSPFTATDLFSPSDFPSFAAAPTDEDTAPAGERIEPPAPERPPVPEPKSKPREPQAVHAAPPLPSARDEHFDLGPNAIDLKSILGEIEPSPPATAHAASESVEVDLSIVLSDIRGAAKTPAAAPAGEGAPGDIDQVFAQLRDEASRRAAMETAEAEYKRALELEQSGNLEECVRALQAAARAPRLRFAAASKLGRIFRQGGQTHPAAEWLERAAQAPAPTPDEGHALLYELAEVLEQEGEVARALAVCMELQADAGSYRDVGERIERLMKVQTGG